MNPKDSLRSLAKLLVTFIHSAIAVLLVTVVPSYAQTTATPVERVKPDPGLVIDYWVHVAIVVGVLGCLVWLLLSATKLFSKAMSDPKGGLWLESHWGGLGGGLGGWRVSNALVYLILLALLGGLTVAAINMAPTYPVEKPDNSQKDSSPKTGSANPQQPPTNASSNTNKGTSDAPSDTSKVKTSEDKTPAIVTEEKK